MTMKMQKTETEIGGGALAKVEAANRVEKFRKLLKFLGEDSFEMPMLSARADVHQILMEKFIDHATGDDGRPIDDEKVKDRLRACNPVDQAGHVSARVEAKNPAVIHVFTADVSGHNGDFFNEERAEIPMFPEFMDLANSILANRAHNKIDEDTKRAETEERAERVRAKMKNMGLL